MVLTEAAIKEMIRLSRLTTPAGRKLYSIARIADMFGVGETTAGRVIHGQGGYAKYHAELAGEGEKELSTTALDAERSLARLLAENPGLVEGGEKGG